MGISERLIAKIPRGDNGKPATLRLAELERLLENHTLEPTALMMIESEINASIERLAKRKEAFLRRELRKHAAEKAE